MLLDADDSEDDGACEVKVGGCGGHHSILQTKSRALRYVGE